MEVDNILTNGFWKQILKIDYTIFSVCSEEKKRMEKREEGMLPSIMIYLPVWGKNKFFFSFILSIRICVKKYNVLTL